MGKKFYAVKKGHQVGVYTTWEACKKQIHGFSGATYKSFATKEEAEDFIKGDSKAIVAATDEFDFEKYDVVAYVDGSYHSATKEFSYGAVFLYKGQEFTFSEKFNDKELATMRNVAGEIKGAECAMKFAVEKECKSLAIFYDYEGIAKWCINEWKANKNGTKAYKQYYDSIKNKVEIQFIKVKAHSGDKYNDMADQLAKKALGL